MGLDGTPTQGGTKGTRAPGIGTELVQALAAQLRGGVELSAGSGGKGTCGSVWYQ